MTQIRICCPCGSEKRHWARGLCRRCYDARRYSERRFGGQRDAVLARDGYACALSGSHDDLNVHHRSKLRFVTLSRGLHTRVHKLRRLPYGMPALFVRLWEEQHGRSRQLEFALAPAPEPPRVQQQPLEFATAA
jgi:5-methylcytosine-specific restriction endonuclease McrA